MFLSITNRQGPATDLGYLLHKHPSRVLSFELPFGRAHVFYPEATERPEYTAPENLERLRARRLGGKRSLALREFALGVEALQRFIRLEPLRKVHECVFAVLALESVPVDPRL